MELNDIKTDSLWYFLEYRTKDGSNTRKRFATLDEALKYKAKKFPLATEIIKTENTGGKAVCFYFFIGGVRLGCARNAEDFAFFLRNKKRIKTKSLAKFLGEKVLNIGDVGKGLVFEILSQTDPMEREIRIMNYKMKNIDKFPEMKELLTD